MTTTERPAVERSPRKDVARNRAKLLKAAEDLVASNGLDLSFNEIARHAGVGVGTVYRHFADRNDLVAAMIDERIERVASIIRPALVAEDAMTALFDTVLAIGELQAGDRGIWQVLAIARPTDRPDPVPERLVPLISRLVERARATGRLREEFALIDVPMLLWISGALSEYAGAVAPGLWRRYVEILLSGLSAPGEPQRPLPDEALSVETMSQLMSTRRPERPLRSGS